MLKLTFDFDKKCMFYWLVSPIYYGKLIIEQGKGVERNEK